MVGVRPPAPASAAARSTGARVPPPVTAGLRGELGHDPALGSPLPVPASVSPPRGVQPHLGACRSPGSAALGGVMALTASLGRWQQVTMLMSPPSVYSSLFLGCPCRGRPDGGSPHRGLTLLEGSAVSAPCQAVARCPCVLQGCPQACPAPPSKRTLSPQTFWSPLCPHRSCGSLTPISAKSIHVPWPSWVSPMGARPGPGLCPASLPGSPTPPSAQRVPKAGGDHPGVFAPSRLEMSWAHPISIPDPILVSNPIPIPAPPWDQPPPQAWWEQPPSDAVPAAGCQGRAPAALGRGAS